MHVHVYTYIYTCWCRKVNKALKDQVDKLWHTTNIYMHPQIHMYGKELAAKLPGKLKVHVHVYIYMCMGYIRVVSMHVVHVCIIYVTCICIWAYICTLRLGLYNLCTYNVCLQVTYFTNSGTEANELAVLMARMHTGNIDIVSLR